ncbi:hypothetical protein EPI10_024054 [Gossypium australe]|uniref:Uncharacterized protein n=1 Tax=Gossypium australe TaxID=47621 RepID=A0A5B6VXI7_9ROSI|nr:hypothetical protein EPI10_024054 [Gossypium australe]
MWGYKYQPTHPYIPKVAPAAALLKRCSKAAIMGLKPPMDPRSSSDYAILKSSSVSSKPTQGYSRNSTLQGYLGNFAKQGYFGNFENQGYFSNSTTLRMFQ